MPLYRLFILVLMSLILLGCDSDSAQQTLKQQQLTISGKISYRERIALPKHSKLIIKLENITSAQKNGEVVAEKTISLGNRQVPIDFQLQVFKDQLNADENYALRASIQNKEGELIWTTDELNLIPTDTHEVSLGVLNLISFQPPEHQNSHTVMFQCGEQQITTVIENESMQLKMNDDLYMLFQVPSASGSKYQSKDKLVNFWNKGHQGILTIADMSWSHCTAVNQDQVEQLPFRAQGHEPEWSLSATYDQVIMTWDGGQKQSVLGETELHIYHAGFELKAYSDTRYIKVETLATLCRDDMSGLPYPYQVNVRLDNLDFQGCGGHSRDLLVGQEWIVQDINQQGIIDFSRLTMTFDDQGRLSGFTSCNQYSTAYEFNERLDVASAITTQKVCPVAIMNQEKVFLTTLADVESLDISINGALVLKTADGRTITARR
ncbi:MAG: hypothetical protein CMH22_11885 [Methylophaga sp.]|uniref:YbaY family lipoprotein n=1 Tax=Methylophaga sp. UBA678 TaxID=1946901 RepID=UPI000C67EEF0|nr:YbaY family lipoprotein [Methylophaga sp. UBA678]MAX52673.1 hypothetical protein [Methylophaga sp.]